MCMIINLPPIEISVYMNISPSQKKFCTRLSPLGLEFDLCDRLLLHVKGNDGGCPLGHESFLRVLRLPPFANIIDSFELISSCE